MNGGCQGCPTEICDCNTGDVCSSCKGANEEPNSDGTGCTCTLSSRKTLTNTCESCADTNCQDCQESKDVCKLCSESGTITDAEPANASALLPNLRCNDNGEIIACKDCPTSCKSCTSLTDCASDCYGNHDGVTVPSANLGIMEQLAKLIVYMAVRNAQTRRTALNAK